MRVVNLVVMMVGKQGLFSGVLIYILKKVCLLCGMVLIEAVMVIMFLDIWWLW